MATCSSQSLSRLQVSLPVGEKPWNSLLPGILVLLAGFALAQVVLGLGGTGKISTVATVSLAGYSVTAGLALCCAVICFYFPLKCLIGGGIANACFLLYFFLFRGSGGFASAVPALPDLPILILAALTGGILAAAAAYSIDFVAMHFRDEIPKAQE